MATPHFDWREVIDDYLTGCRGNLEPKTVTHYTAQLRLLVKWCDRQAIDFSEFRAKHMRQYVAMRSCVGGRSKEGVSQKTRQLDVMCAKTFFQFAYREHYLADDPLKGFPLPRIPRKPYVKTPTSEELRRLFTAIEERWNPAHNPKVRFNPAAQRLFWQTRDTAIFSLLVCTGARVGEILRLKAEHYDPVAKQIVIPIAKDDEYRTVPLTDNCITAIRKYERHRRSRLKKWNMCDSLFVGWMGDAISVNDYGKAFRRYLDYAGLSGFSLHGLKHYAATAMYEVSPRMASVVTGTSVKTLERHYLADSADHVREAHALADPLARVLKRK